MIPRPEASLPYQPMPKGWIPPTVQTVSASRWRLLLGYAALTLGAIPFLRYISVPGVPLEQQFFGYLLFLVCTFPIVTHFSARRPGVPVFPIICLVYCMSYALPVFHCEPILLVNTQRGYVRVLDEYTLEAIKLSLVGVSSMILGFWFFRFSLLNVLVPKVKLDLDPKKGKPMMEFLGFLSVIFMALWIGGVANVPARYLAFVALLSHFGTLSIAYLYYEFLQGRCNSKDKLLLFSMLFISLCLGISMGTVRNASEPLIAIGAVQWTVRQRISWKFVLAGVAFFFALQSIKGIYRTMLAQAAGEKTSIAERIKIMQTVTDVGIQQLLNPTMQEAAGTGNVQNALSRTDIIHLFAHAVSMTPRVVPFQYGETYSYLLYAFIPRAIWPNKPSAQTANEYFGVAYDLQDEDNIGTTSIGMAHLVEAFINFGFFGVIFVMAILGMFYAAIDQLLSHPNAGGGCTAIYATMLFNLINIETATAPTFGAIIQTITIYIIILRYARVRKIA